MDFIYDNNLINKSGTKTICWQMMALKQRFLNIFRATQIRVWHPVTQTSYKKMLIVWVTFGSLTWCEKEDGWSEG